MTDGTSSPEEKSVQSGHQVAEMTGKKVASTIASRLVYNKATTWVFKRY